MSYLKLIEDKIQQLAESMSSTLNIEITVVDNNLLRVAGTGDFQSRLNENSPKNSLFSKILENEIQNDDVYEKNDSVCLNCNYIAVCNERNSITYPIMIDNDIVGITSFATFNILQDNAMLDKKYMYIEILKQFTRIIEKEIESIKNINKLNSNMAEVNTIINSIDKGIIIINEECEITNINTIAINVLNLNILKSNIINKKIDGIISNIKLKSTENKEIKTRWISFDNIIEVIYKMDYIVLDGRKVSTIINFDLNKDKNRLLEQMDTLDYYTFDRIIGNSAEIKNVIEKSKIVSKSDSTVLLIGESGTGKELFAKAIHNSSNRNREEFVALNCSAIPENLIESELFGYERGSFTGANPKGKIGKFEQANNGTLFLDEIGDISLAVQCKLLRAIQERKIDRIGGNKPINVNVRIIAATHKNLFEMVKNNEFREDLYYRINVIPIHVSPLKDRGNDVILCAEYIIDNLCNKMNKHRKKLSDEVIDIFLKYNWAGNIRELENVLEYAINFSTDNKISIANLPSYFLGNFDSIIDNEPIRINEFSIEIDQDLEEMKREFEKVIFKRYINFYGDTLKGKSKIAEKLNISLATLYRKINECM